MATPDFVHASENSRFEIQLDGAVIGATDYRPQNGIRVFTHTEVDEAHQGKGLATQLIEHALNATRAEGLRVVAQCPTVAAFIDKRPEYQDLLAQQDA
jgi:predicted GNAT family acetyltransferase